MLCKRGIAITGALWVAATISGCGPQAWVSRLERISFSAQGLDHLDIATHNGAVAVTGSEGAPEVQVVVTLKGGGDDEASARACLEALEVVSVPDGDTGHRLTWRWKTAQHADWQGSVAFKITLPPQIAVAAQTHNGSITIHTTTAPCRLVTHNGDVEVLDSNAAVDAMSHNGDITATGRGAKVTLVTHNGTIHLDARDGGVLGGRIATHNGNVRVELGEQTSTRLSCRTHNGQVTCAAALQSAKVTKQRTEGVIGAGGAALVVESYNGSIEVTQASGG